MDEDDEAANARLNMLVTALKNEHDRTSKSRKAQGQEEQE